MHLTDRQTDRQIVASNLRSTDSRYQEKSALMQKVLVSVIFLHYRTIRGQVKIMDTSV